MRSSPSAAAPAPTNASDIFHRAFQRTFSSGDAGSSGGNNRMATETSPGPNPNLSLSLSSPLARAVGDAHDTAAAAAKRREREASLHDDAENLESAAGERGRGDDGQQGSSAVSAMEVDVEVDVVGTGPATAADLLSGSFTPAFTTPMRPRAGSPPAALPTPASSQKPQKVEEEKKRQERAKDGEEATAAQRQGRREGSEGADGESRPQNTAGPTDSAGSSPGGGMCDWPFPFSLSTSRVCKMAALCQVRLLALSF